MDARQQRTRSSLRTAILDLSARRPVSTLTVAEVARTAGVTRDTFYRHTTSPADLLADVLGEDLDAIEIAGRGAVADFDAAVVLLLQHVSHHAPIYRAALVEGTEGRLREMLHDVVAARLGDFLLTNPDALPHVPGGLDEDVSRTILVAHCAAGTVAAITVWLRCGAEPSQIPALARTILAAGPRWWAHETIARS